MGQLFGGADDEGVPAEIKLNNEKEYKDFGKTTGEILLKGKCPYHVEKFYKELSKDLGK